MSSGAGFLGRGWAFPPTFEADGSVRLAEGVADVHDSLHILFTTLRGERIMRPEYGGALERFVFTRIDDTAVARLLDAIRFAILHHEPRIQVEDIRVDRSGAPEGRLVFDVRYSVIGTNTRSNMVFPFYQSEGTNVRTR